MLPSLSRCLWHHRSNIRMGLPVINYLLAEFKIKFTCHAGLSSANQLVNLIFQLAINRSHLLQYLRKYTSALVPKYNKFWRTHTSAVDEKVYILTTNEWLRHLMQLVLLRYPKPKPKPRFFLNPSRHRNLGFSTVMEGFLICLYTKFIQGLLWMFFQKFVSNH